MADGVIISSDDESDCEALNSSIFLVEMKEVKNNEDKSSPSVLDEDLMVTFSQRPEVLPHARYDCPIHPFMATDCETSGPVGNNQLTCDQCFCYICDKLASQCLVWCEKGVCHCNSHKRNEFWSNQRNTVVLGYLETFNLSLSEIDTRLRNAETMLQNLKTELEVEVSSCLRGEKVQEYGLNQSSQQGLIRDYTRIYECVSSFLRKADEQEERAAAIMRLGAARELTGQFQPSGAVISKAPETCATKIVLLQRIITSVQRQMVMADFTSEFINKLQSFYQRLKLPSQLRGMRSSLSVRPWNDVLLVSVLKGQNVTGVRKHKGKKDILFEEISVVLLRIELLQHQHRYRELYRYLRVVQTDHSKFFQEVQDLLPFFLCKAGDLTLAMSSFFISCTGPASRLSPYRFLLYLRIFDTATAPVLTSSLQLDCPDNKWEPIEGQIQI
ncbi:uncharacterized protein zgc:112980 [Lampris incognitus]|uniref:uncharacterized protein zgc:112980 n=1 Tax=Lampris incognitus TaxID=2546036 RepID=UPI0024B5B14C|nr:uncharacterized protein zgc:112980 [Lampris incognitus]